MLPVAAQTIPQGEPSLVYFSPKNEVVLDFTIAVEKREVGPYAAFAEELMGVKDVVKENETTHRLESVEICRRTDVDLTRPHVVKAEKNIPIQLLRINEKGLLTGYNCPASAPAKPMHEKARPADKRCAKLAAPASIPEEVVHAGNAKAQAKALAKHIYQLRETRTFLLSGEVEHAPADGKAMELVLEELDKQERELTELFVGKRSVQTEHKLVLWEKIRKSSFRESTIQKDFLYFSEENGFTNKENVDADSITILIGRREMAYQVVNLEQKTSKKGEALSQISYNLPGNALVQVSYKGRMIAERTIPVAQLGIDVPLPQSLFTGKELPKIRFDEKTGNLVRISK